MTPDSLRLNASDLDGLLGRTRSSLLREIGRRGREAGLRVYLVGGSVRDLLLRRAAQDLDFTVLGDAMGFAEALALDWNARVDKHPRFLTASVKRGDGTRVDLSSARSERYPRAGTLPVVSPGDLADDLRRRDFTVNAMALSIEPGVIGRVHDPHGGGEDLRQRRIRTLHEDSFIEDPTRMFRAVRFAARLSFTIPPDTGRTLRAARRLQALQTLSSARLRREIELLLEEETRTPALRLARRHGLWSGVLPGWRPDETALRRVERLEGFFSLREPEMPVWGLVLATLLARVPLDGRELLIRRLHPVRSVSRLLRRAPEAASRLLEDALDGRIREVAALDPLARDLPRSTLCLAGVLARGPALRRLLARYLERTAGLGLEIDGEDLIRAGIPPGPEIAAGLRAARTALLEGRARDAAAQLAAALDVLDIARSRRLSLSDDHGRDE